MVEARKADINSDQVLLTQKLRPNHGRWVCKGLHLSLNHISDIYLTHGLFQYRYYILWPGLEQVPLGSKVHVELIDAHEPRRGFVAGPAVYFNGYSTILLRNRGTCT